MATYDAHVGDVGNTIVRTLRVAGAPLGSLVGASFSVKVTAPASVKTWTLGFTGGAGGLLTFVTPTSAYWDEVGTWTWDVQYTLGSVTATCDPITLSIGARGDGAAAIAADPTPGVAWLPTDLDGCALWLRADTGITLTGGRVSQWAGVGTTLVQATAGRRPTVSSTAIGDWVDFDASAWEALDGAFALAAGSTFDLWAVLRCDLPLVNQSIPVNFYDSGVSNPIILRQLGTNIISAEAANATTLAEQVTIPPFAGVYTAPWVLNFKHSTRQQIVFGNGVPGQADDFTGKSIFAGTGLSLGDYYASGGAGGWAFDGGIAELVLFSRALSIEEHWAMHDYLRARYLVEMAAWA